MTDQSRRSRRGPQIAAQRPDPSPIAPNRARFGIITFSTQVSGEPGPGQCPDNGGAYRSSAHAIACRALGLRHIRTRPYRPRTNGKAERFIRTMLGGWAYERPPTTSAERRLALSAFLDHYNTQRPHRSLNRQTPAERLAERTKTVAVTSSRAPKAAPIRCPN